MVIPWMKTCQQTESFDGKVLRLRSYCTINSVASERFGPNTVQDEHRLYRIALGVRQIGGQ